MTKIEAAELGELNLTPEQLKERQRKLNAMLNKVANEIPLTPAREQERQQEMEKLAKEMNAEIRQRNNSGINLATGTRRDPLAGEGDWQNKAMLEKPRRPRSDKGTARPIKKPEQSYGALTEEQAEKLNAQIKLTFHRREALAVAQMALRDEEIALDSLVKSFVAAGK